MPQAVIADSDDDFEDGRGHSPAAEGVERPEGEGPTRSTDATTSTDASFFQRIYKEHRDAARRDHRDETAEDGKRESAVADTNGAAAMNEASQDPWDVPSSPEVRLTKRANERFRQTTSIKVTRGLRRNLEMLGYESENDVGGLDATSPKRGRKRRKASPRKNPQATRRDSDEARLVDNAQFTRGNPDDIRLVESPLHDDAKFLEHSRDDLNASVVVLPQLPDKDTCPYLLIAPKTLSTSQKLEHQSIKPVPSSPRVRSPNAHLATLASSGTATNANTQRSNLPSSYDLGPRVVTPEHEAIRATKRIRSPRRRRDSSPDVITSMAPPSRIVNLGSKRTRLVQSSTTEAKETRPDCEDGNCQAEMAPSGQAEDKGHLDPSAPDKAATGRKRRGRPIKDMGTGEEEPDVVSTLNGEGVAAESEKKKKKKKRGRPKKAEAAPLAEESTAAGDNGPKETQAVVDERARNGEEDEPGEDDAGGGGNGPEDASPTRCEALDEAAKDTPGSGVEATATVTAAREEKAVLGPSQGGKGTGQEAGKGASRQGAAGTARPMYRVGLSKRLRIEPLLKSLRK